MKKRILFGAFLAFTLSFSTISCSSDDSKEDKTVVVNPDDPNNPGNGGNNGNTSTKYQHKVLIEDATGTWCQYCPRVTYAIEKAKENATHGNKVVAVAIHHSSYQQYPDPMQIEAANTLVSMFSSKHGLTGFPFGLINRSNKWSVPENNNLAQVFNTLNQNGSSVGIKISSNLTNTGGTITADFKFSQGYEDLKYTIYVIENGIVTPQSPQSNSTGFYGGQGANFVHNDVLRAVSGTATGNTLGTVTANQEVSKSGQNVSYTLFNNDLTKVEVVVFVSDASGKVLNVQSAHANETVEYQILN